MDNNANPGLYEDYFSITDSRIDSCQLPDLAQDDQGHIWLSWQSHLGKKDQIKAGRLEKGGVPSPKVVSGPGQAYQSRLHFYDGRMWVIWNESQDKRWKLFMRPVEGDESHVVEIREAAGIFYPAVTSKGKLMTLAWNEREGGESAVMSAVWDGQDLSVPYKLSGTGQAYRPALSYADNGDLFVAYDIFLGNDYGIGLRVLREGMLSDEDLIHRPGSWSASPLLTPIPGGVLMAWYDICPSSMMIYQTAQVSSSDGQPVVENCVEVTRSTSWSNHMALASFGSTVILCHSKGNRMLVLRVRDDSGAWSEVIPLVQNNERYYTLNEKLLMDDRGNLHLVYQAANANGQHPRNAEILYGRLDHNRLPDFEDEELGRFISAFTKPIATTKTLDRHDPDQVRLWLDRAGYKDLDLKFGDIHGQSIMSDGSGEMDHYFNFARYGKPRMDFTALTDHDIFPDVITEAEWEYMRTSANEFNQDGSFVTLLAYEWTSNEFRYSFGHKNVYYPSDEGELFKSTDPEGLTPDRLFASLKAYGAICIPHHPAGVWSGPRSHSTDWDFHDPEVQRLVEIFSRHAPYEKCGDQSPYTKNMKAEAGHFVQDGLARGYRMGFIGGSDSHQMEHGVEGGILGAFLPSLTRSHLFDALYKRFVYATSGAHILLSLKVNGQPMGSELQVGQGQSIRIEGDILGTDALESVVLVRNNEDYLHFKGEGRACQFDITDLPVAQPSYYYLRVQQQDQHQAWSSPIWIDWE